jgi:hypothetical protein
LTSNVIPRPHGHFIEVDGFGAFAEITHEDGVDVGLADLYLKKPIPPRPLLQILRWYFGLIRRYTKGGTAAIHWPDDSRMYFDVQIAHGGLAELLEKLEVQA